MVMCPNLSNPDVAREFNEIKEAVGEVAAYLMWSENNGNGVDKAPNGADSILFKDLLKLSDNNRIKAILLKSKVYSKSFKEWFGNWTDEKSEHSKALDENKEPKILYHGTNKQFEQFDVNAHSEHKVHNRGGIFFTDTYNKALVYGSTVIPAYLNMRNPGVISVLDTGKIDNIEEENKILQDNKYDSAKFTRIDKEGENKGIKPTDQYIVKNESLIKSINNIGSFSNITKNIYDNTIILDIFNEDVYDLKNNLENKESVVVLNYNSFIKDRDDYIIEYIKLNSIKDLNSNIRQLIHKAKNEFVQKRQLSIILDTLLKLALNFNLTLNEDGTWSGNNGLVILFMNYIEWAKGYYDHNTTSTLASHIINISLSDGDPSTFNHELAHHYLRMFWDSELVQTALAAVYKKGMTDEEVEEALVDVITMKTTDTKTLSSIEKPSFFHTFWTKFGYMLYKNIHIKNNATRNALFNNISMSFFYNRLLKLADKQNLLIHMANQRMYLKKNKYKEYVSKARQKVRLTNQLTNYQAIQNDRSQAAISTIIKGTISRNKSYRRDSLVNNKTLVTMLLLEDEVRLFAKEIQLIREDYKNNLKSNGKLTAKLRYEMSHTDKEIEKNKNIIRSFILNSRDLLFDLSEKLLAAEETGFSLVLYKEVVDASTNETTVLYLDKSHINDEGILSLSISFLDLQQIKQNTIGFYNKVFRELKIAVSHPSFAATYGEDFKNEMYQELFGISNDPNRALIIGAINILDSVDLLYNNAALEHIMKFVNKYINENVKLSDEYKQRMIFSIQTWLEDQNTFGDIGSLEVWLGLASNSKSPVIRMLCDIIDNILQEKHFDVKKKGEELKLLRSKAMKKLTLLGFSITNFEKIFMEKDGNDFTGNFSSEINEGKYHKDRLNFLNELLYSKNGVQSKVRNRILDNKFDLEIDETGYPEFPNGCEDIEKECLHKINDWTSKHAVRQFTKEYYDIRIDMLSSTTRKARAKINDSINKIITACTVDGKVRTDLLPHTKQMELLRLYRNKLQMSNPFYSDGSLKLEGTDEYQIAKELTEFADFVKDKVKYKIDIDAYLEALDNAKDKELFERENTYNTINPDIWNEMTKLFPKTSTKELDELRQRRRKLVSLIQAKGLSYPRIDMIWDDINGEIRPQYAKFWLNLKSLDELILKERNKIAVKKMDKSTYLKYRALLSKVSVPYENSKNINISWYTHIELLITQKITLSYPNDPLLKEKIKLAMEPFVLVLKDDKGNVLSESPLSIFMLSAPSGNRVLIDDVWKNSIIKEPILAYSKVDMDASDGRFVDKRFNLSLGKPQLPVEDRHNVVDENGKKISYTNDIFYNKIFSDDDVKAYYDALISTMKESYESIPFAGKYDGRLPQIGATTLLMILRTNPLNVINFHFKRNWGMPNESDVDINSDYELRPDGSRSMNIPVRFIRRLDDPSQINSDVFGSVMTFYEMAKNYNLKVNTLPIFLTFLDKLNNNDSKNTRQRTMLKGMINRQFYDKLISYDTDDDNNLIFNGKLAKWGLKVLPSIKGLTQTGLLAFSLISGLISYLDPAISLDIEALLGKYFNYKDWLFGHTMVLCHLGNAIRGAGSTRAYGKVPAAISHFGMNNTGSLIYRNSNMSLLNRLAHSDVAMWPFQLGEYTISARVLATMMHSYRYYQGKYYNKREFVNYCTENGIMTADLANKYFNSSDMSKHTLYQAYEVNKKTGALLPKDNIYGEAITSLFEKDFAKRVKNRTNNFILKVPQNEKSKIQTLILISFIMVMRTFMLNGIGDKFKNLHDFLIEDNTIIDEEFRTSEAKRLKKEFSTDKGGYNFQTQEIENGITSAALKSLTSQPLTYAKYIGYLLSHPFLSRYNEDKTLKRLDLKIDDTDLYAVSKFLTEIGVILLLSILSAVWHNKIANDGEDDTYCEVMIDLILLRLTIERLTFVNPGTGFDIITSITPSKGDIDKKIKFIDLMLDLYIGINEHGIDKYSEWDKVKSGTYAKETKVFENFMKTISSVGLHNLYSMSNTSRLKIKKKFYDKIWTPATPFYSDENKDKKKKSSKKSKNEDFSTFMPM